MPKSLEAKLADKIDRQNGDGCWIWTGSLNVWGYGKIRPESITVTCEYGYTHHLRQKQQQAHRVVYEMLAGPIPDGMQLDHLCRNRQCVRPDHLEPVTAQENARRIYADKTHCVNGHELTEENTYVWHEKRACRICRTRAVDRHKAKKGVG
jgi:hypothetical protein